MSNSIIIHPRDFARAVVVLETDDQHSGFEFYPEADGMTAAYLMGRNPSVLAWLPAFAHGVLRVYTKNTKVAGEPKHFFDLKIHACSDVRIDDDDVQLNALPNEVQQELAMGLFYNIECPEGSNRYHLKWCPAGQHAVCDDGEVICEAGGPGG